MVWGIIRSEAYMLSSVSAVWEWVTFLYETTHSEYTTYSAEL